MKFSQAVAVAVLAAMSPEQALAMPTGGGGSNNRKRARSDPDDQPTSPGWGFGIWNRVSSVFWSGDNTPTVAQRDAAAAAVARDAAPSFNVPAALEAVASGNGGARKSKGKTTAKGVTKTAGKKRGSRVAARLANSEGLTAAVASAGRGGTRSGRSFNDDGNTRPAKRARTTGGGKAKKSSSAAKKEPAKSSQSKKKKEKAAAAAPSDDAMDESSNELGEEWEDVGDSSGRFVYVLKTIFYVLEANLV